MLSPAHRLGSMSDTSSSLPADQALRLELERAGFYPDLTSDIVNEELEGAVPRRHYLHLETHVEAVEVHRHAIVLVLTDAELIILHIDDAQYAADGQPIATFSVESVPLQRLHTVVLSGVVARPAEYKPGQSPRELTFSLSWSGSARAELAPAQCGDPECIADHGLTGQLSKEDLAMRVSADADGQKALDAARQFARDVRRACSAAAYGRTW